MKTSVYFDGQCILCSQEIQHYAKLKGAENLRFVDISSPHFSAEAEKVELNKIHKIMHVRDKNGDLQTKVDAFITIWSELPQYQWLARLAKKNTLRFFLDLGYDGFVKIRPYLPRRKNALCTDGTCELRYEK